MRDPGPVVRGAERVWCPCPGGQGGAEHRAEKTTRAPHPQSTPSAEGAGGRRVSSSWPRAPDPRPPAAPLRPNSSSGCTRRRPPPRSGTCWPAASSRTPFSAASSQLAGRVPLHSFARCVLFRSPLRLHGPEETQHVAGAQPAPPRGSRVWPWPGGRPSGQSPGGPSPCVPPEPPPALLRPALCLGLRGRGRVWPAEAPPGTWEGRIRGPHSPGPCPAGLVTSVAMSLP